MSESDHYPSYSACVARALSSSRQPLDVDELISEVAVKRPVGKAAHSAVHRALDKLFQAVPVGSGRYGWLSHLLEGTVYCHPLTSEEIRRGYLLLDELEHSVFFPQFFQHYRPDDRVLTVSMFGGPTVRAEAAIERKTWSLRLGEEFVTWLDELGAENRDDIIITVQDACQGKYEIRARLREMRDERAIEQRNIRLALLAEELVAEDSRTREIMPTWELVARLIGRDFYKSTPPTDDLHYVLHEYSMLRFTDGVGYQLNGATVARYSDRGHGGKGTRDGLAEAMTTRQYRNLGSKGLDKTDRGQVIRDAGQEWYESGDREERGGEDDFCPAYQQYLDNLSEGHNGDAPLRHEEFHLLEAELDLLMQLQAEFGILLPEQLMRRDALAARLYIDPDSLASMGWDAPDDPNLEDPPSWQN